VHIREESMCHFQ